MHVKANFQLKINYIANQIVTMPPVVFTHHFMVIESNFGHGTRMVLQR